MTSRDVDFLERDSLDRPLSDVSSTTYHYSSEKQGRPGNTYHMTGCEVDVLLSVRALNDEV